MDNPVYVIRDWSALQANTDLSKTQNWTWVKVPNRHDGGGYGRVAKHPQGAAIFAAWVLMLQVASRCPVRGILASADGPLDSTDLAIKTQFPKEIFDAAFAELVHPKIGWLVADNWPDHYQRVVAAVESSTSGAGRVARKDGKAPKSGQKAVSSGQNTDPSGCHPDTSGRNAVSSGLDKNRVEKRREEESREEERRKNTPPNPRKRGSVRGAGVSASGGDAFPPTIDTPAFRACWSRYAQHRRELRKPLSAVAQEAKLRKIAATMPLAQAIAAIDRAIESNWQGIPGIDFTPRGDDFAAGPGPSSGRGDGRSGANGAEDIFAFHEPSDEARRLVMESGEPDEFTKTLLARAARIAEREEREAREAGVA